MADISVRFWGVRGSIACPGPEFARYGGNTACVEVRCGDRLVIFDGGTGLRPLGNALAAAATVDTDIFLSHFHIDHVCGLPFFAPLFGSENRLRLWAGNLLPERGIAQALHMLMDDPLFPTGIESFKAGLDLRDFRAGETLTPHGGMTVRTAPLHHPGRATGYRLDFDGRSVAYVTDTEHWPDRPDKNVLNLVAGADLMIYDGNYTDAEWSSRVGWGHSSWQEGVRLAAMADVRKVAIFHHDPDHDDSFLDRVATEAAAMRSRTIVAAEGMTLAI